MSASAVAEFALELLRDFPTMIESGLNVVGQIHEGMTMLENMRNEDRGPTQAEYEAMREKNAELHRQFQSLGGGDAEESAGGDAASG